MFRNIYYDTRKSEVHLWEQINGENLYDVIPWTPYVFVPSKKENSDAKTIDGEYVSKMVFNTYYNYNDFNKNNNRTNVYENNVRGEIQYLSERYNGIPDEEIEVPNLIKYYLDIEVIGDEGFPDWRDPKDPVVLVSIRNGSTKKTITFGYDCFGSRNYTGNIKNSRYIKCENERDLIRYVFNYLHKYPCDVLSGFYIYGFDLPYLINRSKVLWGEAGEEMYRRMSPINAVSVWKQRSTDDINIDIGGQTILDYIDLYKQYGKNLERYTLEYVCQTEIGVGKLENPYDSHRELAEKDWNRFVDYNIIDCERVDDLEGKLGYISMAQTLCLLCKVPMKYYNVQNQLIEGLMLSHYRRNGLCAPHFYGGEKEHFPAAIVKEPHKGLHKWVVDIDLTSSYPSHIITLNMSIETFFGKIARMRESEIILYTRNKEFPEFKLIKIDKNRESRIINFSGNRLVKFNMALKKGLFAISPCGSIFRTDIEGVVAKVERNMFFKRKEVKAKEKEFGLKSKDCIGIEKDKCKEKERNFNSLQNAIKIMMNAFFGITSVPYSRYYNIDLAKAITSCGRHTIKSGEKFCNEILNNPSDEILSLFNGIRSQNNKEIDYIKYIDTDSLFVAMDEWIKNQGIEEEWERRSDEEKIELIRKISAYLEKYIDNRIFNEVQLLDYNSQIHDFKIGFKQEIIAKTALFIKKKKYAYWLLNKEGIPKNEVKVKGLEIVRSETSESVRPKLKKIMEMIMKQESNDLISSTIRNYKNTLINFDPMDLAANIGVNGIKKYLGKGTPIKGTPWHVKGVYGYRMLLKDLGIEDKYEDIHEGLKAKVVYVKKNQYNIETITFYEWPKEFDTVIQLDSEKMIDKFFINKIRFLLNPIGTEKDILDIDMNAVRVFF